MAVNSIATMAIRIVVTTCPRPRSLSTPNTDMGATGWITMMPYRIRSQSVSERLRRGTLAGGLALELIPFLKTKPHYPAEITGLGEGSLVAPGVQIAIPCRSSTKFLSNSIRKRYSVQWKNTCIKTIIAGFRCSRSLRRNSTESRERIHGREPQNAISTLLPLPLCLLAAEPRSDWRGKSRPKNDGARKDRPGALGLSLLRAPAGHSRRRPRYEPFRQPGHV